MDVFCCCFLLQMSPQVTDIESMMNKLDQKGKVRCSHTPSFLFCVTHVVVRGIITSVGGFQVAKSNLGLKNFCGRIEGEESALFGGEECSLWRGG